jgi:hypothetical protein
MSLKDFITTNVMAARSLTREEVDRFIEQGSGRTIPEPTQTETEWLLTLPLDERVNKCLELGRRDVPVAQDEKVEIEVELTSRAQPGLVVYEDRPVARPMTHEALAELAKPHAPREGEVTADHVAAWLKEKS